MTVEDMRLEYKLKVLQSLSAKDYDTTIKYFNLWQYVYEVDKNIDKYEYDNCLLSITENQLSSEFPIDTSKTKYKIGEKIRIVYLTHVLNTPSAIMAKILIDLIKYHDTSKFEIHVFTLESWIQVYMSPGKEFISKFKELGCKVHYASPLKFGFKKLLSITKEINNINPHIMTTCVALADFNHFFISALKPAPIRISFVVGPPAQFIPPSFDYGLSWFTHSIADCPVPCLYTGIIYIPKDKPSINLSRSDLGIPDDALVITSTGRYTKFQDDRVLNLIIEAMQRLKNLHYVMVMSDIDKFKLLDNVSDEIKNRIHVFGWCSDYEKYLSISDIYLDTFPSGGGTTIQDAALLKLPIISFEDDLGIPFDQSNWNPAEDLLPSESMIMIRRYHIEDLKVAVYDLYRNKNLREEMGNKAYQSISSMRLNISNNVKKIENLYIKLVEEKLK
jgi:predicted O-linked N-acetylglucosamine transferase (SPINDLY family)